MYKLIFLFLAVWMTLINIELFISVAFVPAVNFILQAIGITGFIWLQWLN